MVNPVQLIDLEDRWRPLAEQERMVAQSLLDDAWAILLNRVPDLAGRLDDGSLDAALVVAVESAMVLRVLKNPDGKRQESIDDYSWTIDVARSAGLLYVTSDELRLLGGRGAGSAFTITLAGDAATPSLADRPDLWFQWVFAAEQP